MMLTPSPSDSPPSADAPLRGEGGDERTSNGRAAVIFAWICVALGAACLVVVKLSIPAMMLALIAFLALPKGQKAPRIALLIVAPMILAGLVRFTIYEAAPGVVEGGRRAVARSAIAHLRDIVFAQDIARQQAFVDPDGDGIGSAVSLWALAGHTPSRGETAGGTKTPRLLQRFQHKAVGEGDAAKALGANELVIYDGYVFAVYLPAKDGGAVTSSMAGAKVDDERAEQRFVAYAWPLEKGHAEHAVVFIDEHERILISDNEGEAQNYFGLDRPPAFNAALTGGWSSAPAVIGKAIRNGGTSDEGSGKDGGVWRRWRHKEARDSLPGAKAGE